MENTFRQYSGKSEVSLKLTSNPVVSPKTHHSYLPYSQAQSRGVTTSPELTGFFPRSPRDLNSMKIDDFHKFESALTKLIEKSKTNEHFHLACLNLKNIGKVCLNGLGQNEKSSFSRLFRSVLENLALGLDEILKSELTFRRTIKELETEKEKTREITVANKLLQSQVSKYTTDKPKPENFINNEIANRRITVEKEKYLEKIQLLEDHIAELRDVTKIEQISAKMENYKTLYEKLGKEYKMYSKERDTLTFRFQQEIGLLKNEIASNKDYLSSYQIRERDLEAQLKYWQGESRRLKEAFNEAKEGILMFREDMTKFFNYKEMHDSAIENVNNWKNKYTQLELNVMSGNFSLSQDGVVWVDINDPIFTMFRKGPPIDLGYKKIDGNQLTMLDTSPTSKGRRKTTFEVSDLSDIDLREFKLNRPNFAAFLELSDGRIPFECPFNNWVEATVRGIYDSKYYEHMMCTPDSCRLPSRFPEFVFGWLGSFTVDKVSRTVKELETWKKPGSDKIRLDLILGLSQDKYKKNWEIQTFIEFLNEEMAVDELAFFLHCRNLLFKGPQLSIVTGQFSYYHLIPLKQVEEVMEIVMGRISPAEQEELKTLLTSKSKIKEGTYSIDSSLVLRLMLEYYIREKKSRYVAIRTLFNLVPRNRSVHLDFNGFRELITNVNPDITDQTVAKLFRECHTLSGGVFTPEIIFIVCNESGFFFQSLCLKAEKKVKESDTALLGSLATTHKADLNLIRDVIKGVGISDVLYYFNKLEQIVLGKEMNKGFTNVKQLFKNIWNLIRQVSNVFIEVNSFNFIPFLTEQGVKDELSSGPESCKSFVELLENLVIYKLSTKRAIRKIQRNWKGRNSLKMVDKGIGAYKKHLTK